MSFSSATNTHFYTLFLSDFFFFCSFILSHPLYFSYFIFFSPYLLKLLSFLSPLFITTSLLLLALLTASPGLMDNNPSLEASDSKVVGFLLSTYRKVADTLQSKPDDGAAAEVSLLEELEECVVVFATSSFKVGENPVEMSLSKCHVNDLQYNDSGLSVPEALTSIVEEKPVEVPQIISERYNLESFLQGAGVAEDLAFKEEEKQVEMEGTGSNKFGEKQEEPLMGNGSEALRNEESESPVKVSLENGGEYSSKGSENPPIVRSNFGSFGSMRKEREWKRTLACMLYEERQSVDEEEGMDLLWEAYESDSGKVKVKSKEKVTKKVEVEYDEEEEEDDINDGQLCCLQALKFSTRKMNLGMGRPNLVKVSKALKGIGWLNQISRHGKKG